MTQEADNLDQAAALTQHLTDSYVAQARSLSKPEQVQNPDGTWPVTECIDCEAEIPAGRLALGRIRCVHCQEDNERRARRRG